MVFLRKKLESGESCAEELAISTLQETAQEKGEEIWEGIKLAIKYLSIFRLSIINHIIGSVSYGKNHIIGCRGSVFLKCPNVLQQIVDLVHFSSVFGLSTSIQSKREAIHYVASRLWCF